MHFGLFTVLTLCAALALLETSATRDEDKRQHQQQTTTTLPTTTTPLPTTTTPLPTTTPATRCYRGSATLGDPHPPATTACSKESPMCSVDGGYYTGGLIYRCSDCKEVGKCAAADAIVFCCCEGDLCNGGADLLATLQRAAAAEKAHVKSGKADKEHWFDIGKMD